jgi:AraC-like DNA-binding protein
MPSDLIDSVAPPAAWRASSIHSSYLRIAFALAEKMGLHTDARAPTQARLLPFLDILPLLDLLDVKRRPQLGAALGDLVPAAAHGALGYAVVSSATIGQAMQTVARFAPMRNRLFSYTCSADDTETVLRLEPSFEMRGYRRFVEIGTTVSVFKMIQSLAGAEAAAKMRFDANWSEAYSFPCPIDIRYSRGVSALRVPAEVANAPTLTADAKLYAIACQNCTEELAILDGSIAARLRAIMPDENNSWPTLVDAAGHVALSPRTLIRKLAAEGLSYQALLDEAKGEMACWYLRNTALPLSQIADHLGFLDDSNFSRSFRRWRHTTPLSYRKSRRAVSENSELHASD